MRAATTTVNATVATFNFNQFLAPTLAADSSRTTTHAATLYVNAPPTAGTNITITNPYALWVDAGNTRLDGFLGVGTLAPATTQFYVQAQSSGNVTAILEGSSGASVDLLQVKRGSTNVFVLNLLGRSIFTPQASSSNSIPYFRLDAPADGTLSASTEAIGVRIGGDSGGSTVTRTWGTGALATQREVVFPAPTYGFAGTSTLTDAATLDVTAPIPGPNATITNSAAIWGKAGATTRYHGRFGTTPALLFRDDGTRMFIRSTASAGEVRFEDGSGNTRLLIAPNGAAGLQVEGAGVTADSLNATLGNRSSRPTRIAFGINSTADAYLYSTAAATFRFGFDDAASPVAQVLGVQGASGSNVAGANFTITGSRGTGTGVGGNILFQTAAAGTSGSSQNALATAFTINQDGSVQLKSATFANLPTQADGKLIYCSDCTIASPCAGSGTGAMAKGINGAWVCN